MVVCIGLDGPQVRRAHREGATMNRKPPFALWVENVDPERVDAKDLWEAFAR